ncbi:HAAS signaling domain-containing protein [Roseateles sp. LYH14W]|uniref:HAAS signaling domain-containing protein n=1 Tax=Pelomonas parva TaxID=3299032 RepID=A0ABW7F9X0_9BURK
MNHQEAVRQYTQALARFLAPLRAADADEVIREIEGHVLDVIEQQQRSGLPVDVEALLAGFGDPRELAASYVVHVLAGTPPPRGFRALQSVKRGVTRGLYWTMAAFGYSVAALCALLALVKLWAPDTVGVWTSAHGNSVVVDIVSRSRPGEHELLGALLIPMALLLALAVAELTRRVLQALGRGMTAGAGR